MPTSCKQCGTENLPGAKFCLECGKPLPVPVAPSATKCPDCGHENVPGAKFCNACGAKLPQAKTARKPGRPVEKTIEQRMFQGFQIGMSSYQRQALNMAKDKAVSLGSPEFKGAKASLNVFVHLALRSWFAEDLAIDFDTATIIPGVDVKNRKPLRIITPEPEDIDSKYIKWYQTRLTQKQFEALDKAYEQAELIGGRYQYVDSKNKLVLTALRNFLANKLDIDFDIAQPL
jgi:hypothetical protein